MIVAGEASVKDPTFRSIVHRTLLSSSHHSSTGDERNTSSVLLSKVYGATVVRIMPFIKSNLACLSRLRTSLQPALAMAVSVRVFPPSHTLP